MKMRKLALQDEILMQVEKPARYIGNEINAVMKNKEEIAWNEEEQRPEYIKAKLLIHNDRFNVQVDASK